MSAAAEAVLRLLDARAAGKTICPSEVARALAADAGADADWRGRMPAVHAAVDTLVAARAVRLSWKGASLPARDGPYRIARGAGDASAATTPTPSD